MTERRKPQTCKSYINFTADSGLCNVYIDFQDHSQFAPVILKASYMNVGGQDKIPCKTIYLHTVFLLSLTSAFQMPVIACWMRGLGSNWYLYRRGTI